MGSEYRGQNAGEDENHDVIEAAGRMRHAGEKAVVDAMPRVGKRQRGQKCYAKNRGAQVLVASCHGPTLAHEDGGQDL
jgi:hypothetical protein